MLKSPKHFQKTSSGQRGQHCNYSILRLRKRPVTALRRGRLYLLLKVGVALLKAANVLPQTLGSFCQMGGQDQFLRSFFSKLKGLGNPFQIYVRERGRPLFWRFQADGEVDLSDALDFRRLRNVVDRAPLTFAVFQQQVAKLI